MIFDKAIIKLLSYDFIKSPVEYAWHLYHIAQLNNAKNYTLNGTYRTIKKYQLDMTSDFSKRDAKALEQVVQKAFCKNMTVIEVGSWKGFSTSVIAADIKDWGGRVYAVDHWKGNAGVPHHEQAKTDDILSVFRLNMKMLELDNVYPMVMPSLDASRIISDKSADLIFIDADHRYTHILEDVRAWIPKIKDGGIISGHDCEGKYSTFGTYRKQIEDNCEEDVIMGVCHPGVVKALYDIFGDDYEIVTDSSVWWKKL